MHARPTTVLLSLFWSDATMRIRISGKLIRHLNETRWNQPAIVGARQGNLFGKSSAANPSESIWNHITSHLKHMLSTSELSTLSPFNAVAISLVYLYLVLSNPTHTIGLQLNHQCMHCNEVNVFRKLLVTSLGKSTLPIKKVGKCNGGKRARSAVWNEQADQQLPRPH